MKFEDYVKEQQSKAFLKFVCDNSDKDWDWYGLSVNSNINFYKHQNWNLLSLDPNLMFENIKNNFDKPWDWSDLSGNPNITFEDIKNNSDKPWDWSQISFNSFKLQNKLIRDQCRKELFAANKIKKNWIYVFRI